MVGTSPLLLFAGGAQYKNGDIKGFLKNYRSSKVPLALAHSGNGSISHLSSELFASATGIKVNAIPYRGSAPALTDVAAGQVDAHFATLASGSSLLVFFTHASSKLIEPIISLKGTEGSVHVDNNRYTFRGKDEADTGYAFHKVYKTLHAFGLLSNFKTDPKIFCGHSLEEFMVYLFNK